MPRGMHLKRGFLLGLGDDMAGPRGGPAGIKLSQLLERIVREYLGHRGWYNTTRQMPEGVNTRDD
jgi:hypothetical protein